MPHPLINSSLPIPRIRGIICLGIRYIY